MLETPALFRKLLTAGLAVALALNTFSPVVLLGAVESRPMTDAGPRAGEPERCCCGSDDGRCCGQGCCEVEPSELPSEPVPAPQRSESQRHWGVSNSSSTIAATAPPATPPTCRLDARSAVAPAESSLQNLQVRLDI